MQARCSICVERFTLKGRDVKPIAALQCGHTFHYVCILQWIQHSCTCPSCRHPSNERSIIQQLFFDETGDSTLGAADPSFLELQIVELKEELAKKEEASKETAELKAKVTSWETKYNRLSERCNRKEQAFDALKGQLTCLQTCERKCAKLEKETKELREQLSTLKRVETLVFGSQSNADELLATSNIDSLRDYVSVLKRQGDDLTRKKHAQSQEILKLRHERTELQRERDRFSNDVAVLREEIKIRRPTDAFSSTPCNPRLKEILKDSPLTPFGAFLEQNDPDTPMRTKDAVAAPKRVVDVALQTCSTQTAYEPCQEGTSENSSKTTVPSVSSFGFVGGGVPRRAAFGVLNVPPATRKVEKATTNSRALFGQAKALKRSSSVTFPPPPLAKRAPPPMVKDFFAPRGKAKKAPEYELEIVID